LETWLVADRQPQPALITPSASPEEAAAILAAVERFRRATSQRDASPAAEPETWLRVAILEGVSRQPLGGTADPWINT
jgi:hypothetical protein